MSTKTTDETARQVPVMAFFRVKVRLDTPFDFAALQLYKAWPKPKDRRDN